MCVSERYFVIFLLSLVLNAFPLGCFRVRAACRDFVQHLGWFKLLTVTNFTWIQIHFMMDSDIMQKYCKIQTAAAGDITLRHIRLANNTWSKTPEALSTEKTEMTQVKKMLHITMMFCSSYFMPSLRFKCHICGLNLFLLNVTQTAFTAGCCELWRAVKKTNRSSQLGKTKRVLSRLQSN